MDTHWPENLHCELQKYKKMTQNGHKICEKVKIWHNRHVKCSTWNRIIKIELNKQIWRNAKWPHTENINCMRGENGQTQTKVTIDNQKLTEAKCSKWDRIIIKGTKNNETNGCKEPQNDQK